MRRVFRWAGRKEGLGGSRMHACMSMLKQVYRKPHVYCKHIHHKILVHHKVYTHSAHNHLKQRSQTLLGTLKKTKISGIQKKNLPTDLSNQAVSSFLIRLYSPPSTPSIKPHRNATFPPIHLTLPLHYPSFSPSSPSTSPSPCFSTLNVLVGTRLCVPSSDPGFLKTACIQQRYRTRAAAGWTGLAPVCWLGQ